MCHSAQHHRPSLPSAPHCAPCPHLSSHSAHHTALCGCWEPWVCTQAWAGLLCGAELVPYGVGWLAAATGLDNPHRSPQPYSSVPLCHPLPALGPPTPNYSTAPQPALWDHIPSPSAPGELLIPQGSLTPSQSCLQIHPLCLWQTELLAILPITSPVLWDPRSFPSHPKASMSPCSQPHMCTPICLHPHVCHCVYSSILRVHSHIRAAAVHTCTTCLVLCLCVSVTSCVCTDTRTK